jgi:hypothetical protein
LIYELKQIFCGTPSAFVGIFLLQFTLRDHIYPASIASVASFFSEEPARKSALPKLPNPGPDACFSPPTASESNRAMAFAAHQRVRVNLAGLMIQGVTFHAAVTDALATIVRKSTEEPPAYLVDLLFSFKGLKQIEVSEERIRPA